MSNNVINQGEKVVVRGREYYVIKILRGKGYYEKNSYLVAPNSSTSEDDVSAFWVDEEEIKSNKKNKVKLTVIATEEEVREVMRFLNDMKGVYYY